MTIGATPELKSATNTDAAMAAEIRRDSFKHFWDKYSDKPDTNTMMLNNSAEDLEAADRADILSCLPHLADKDVVDIGAGIGRFTTILAQTAKSVLSTDFIHSFIVKNMERNAHIANVNYQVGDAVNLQMERQSVDLVFTNWLMMYLSDEETIAFVQNCMRWLRPNGYVHLRESCSEPSTGRTKTNTMHNTAEANPTHYRFSSLYIELLRNIRYRDNEGKLWKFDVHWSCSVPTYIKRSNNWRQVHWLSQKVEADELDQETTREHLHKLISDKWFNEQKEWDNKLDRETYVWTDKIFSSALSQSVAPQKTTAFVFTPRTVSPYLHVNSHLLAEKLTCNVWNQERVPFLYRTSLTKANTIKDLRVRFSWNSSLASGVDYWNQRAASFSSFIGTELLSTTTEEERKSISSMMNADAKLVILEPFDTINEDEIKEKLSAMGIKNVKMTEVSDDCTAAQTKYFLDHSLEDESVAKKWLLIEGSF